MMKKIWLLIYVYRGLIQEPEIFHDKDSAVKREAVLRPQMNPDYDEVGVFEKEIE